MDLKAPQDMTILRTPDDCVRWRRQLSPGTRVGFVPTMGALHEGHGELLTRMRPRCDVSVLSIFVNPAQFGPNEDLAKYPRTFEKDLALARSRGVDVVFAPLAEAMYHPGHATYVEETELSKPLCGQFRPEHFRGVTTIVLKLFNLVKPHLAFFGLKDAQQFFVLNQMVRDLNLELEVEGIATVREQDGLALSSRNAYLSREERAKAPRLYEALKDAAAGNDTTRARKMLEEQGFRVQYLEFRSLPSFQPLARPLAGQPALLAAAAYLGNTRLIDNIIVNPSTLASHGIRAQL